MASHKQTPTRRARSLFFRQRGRVGLLPLLSAFAVAFLGISSAMASTPGPAGEPTGSTTVVSDPMTRASSFNWGSAPIGGRYSSNNDGSFSTDGNHGIISVPGNATARTATLSDVSVRDASATISLALESAPTSGGGVATGILLRSAGGSSYRGSVKLTPTGQSILSITRIDGSAYNQVTLGQGTLSVPLKPGKLFYLQFRAIGALGVSLSARLWAAGSPRPDWQVTLVDPTATSLKSPGAVSLWSYVSAQTTAMRIFADNFRVTAETSSAGTVLPPPSSPTPASSPSTPDPSTPPAPPAPPTSPSTSTGSAALGSTNYPIPAAALFVSPRGSNSATGTQDDPLQTVGAAIARATSGGTIVMRAGSYHEGVTIPNNKSLTIQSYPKEAAWFEGSSVVDNWVKTGAVWTSANWTAQFDSSPTFTFGAPDGTSSAWQFVNPAYPMAAHPDQVWIGGVSQQQVASLSQVGAGKFFVDYSAHKLYLGSDPSSGTVRASDIAKAISIRGAGSTVRGIGVERFAPSVAHMGAVTAELPNVTIENVTINDSATTGLFVMQSGDVIRNVTLLRNGMLGSSMSTADHLTISGMLASGNNTENFNNAPVSGGLKISRSRGVTVTNSDFSGNNGPGLWFDESVYDGTVTGSTISNNDGHGLILEISTKFVIANNLILGNSDNGIKLNNTSDVAIWNNTLSGNGRSINIVQDSRQSSNRQTAGHDPRQAFPDPTMNWVNKGIVVSNNVIAATTAPDCLLCIQDYTGGLAPGSGIQSNGNIFGRSSPSAPKLTVLWAPGGSPAASSTTLAGFASATGHDSRSVEVTGTAVTHANGSATAWLLAHDGDVALRVPGNVAAAAGISASAGVVGAALN
jgi:hypothetical protein